MSVQSIPSIPRIIRESSRGYDCIPIEDELLRFREIFLTEDVDSASMDRLIKQLMYLNREDPEAEIPLYINSPGGEVHSGLAVYDFLKLMKAPVRTVCIGTAAFMGAILFLAGDCRVMMPHARMMIHDPAPGGGSMGGMKPAELEEHLQQLKKIQTVTCRLIADITGRTEQEVLQLTRKDSWFNAEEAVKFGLATEILTSL